MYLLLYPSNHSAFQMYLFIFPFIHSSIHPFNLFPIHLFIFSFIHSFNLFIFTYLYICCLLFICSFIYALIYLTLHLLSLHLKDLLHTCHCGGRERKKERFRHSSWLQRIKKTWLQGVTTQRRKPWLLKERDWGMSRREIGGSPEGPQGGGGRWEPWEEAGLRFLLADLALILLCPLV